MVNNCKSFSKVVRWHTRSISQFHPYCTVYCYLLCAYLVFNKTSWVNCIWEQKSFRIDKKVAIFRLRSSRNSLPCDPEQWFSRWKFAIIYRKKNLEIIFLESSQPILHFNVSYWRTLSSFSMLWIIIGVLLAKITYLKKSALFLAENSGIQYCWICLSRR